MCHNPSLGLATKARACKGAGQERGPKVWESVRMNTHTPKWISIIGSWSPVGLLKLQRVIARVKTPRLVKFFISLKNYWNLDVQNGLTWPIWTSATQVMAKRRVVSQTNNLTPDHRKSWIDSILLWCAPKFLVRFKVGPTMLKSGSGWNLLSLPASNTKGGERGVLKAPGLD